MHKNCLYLLLATVFLFAATPAHAQSNKVDVNGVVTDSLGASLAGATVVLLQASDSTLVGYGTTNAEGAFRMRRVRTGSYVLQITFVGFAPYSEPLAVNGDPVDVGMIALQEEATELEALVITAEHIPMVIKNDTLEYNAAAFKVRPNANVEELLKRLPGVDVERDGTIKAQGETVEQVLVDGKEFFGDDPRIATQNLPADAVDKVQVFDKKSDMAEFSGVDDGEERKTINLALNEDSKQGYFGNASGGWGGDELASTQFSNRYEGKANINRFSPTTQLSLIGNLNNINERGFSITNLISMMGGLQMMGSGGGRITLPFDPNVNDGFSRTTAAGLNFNHDFNAKTDLQSSYFYNGIDNTKDRLVNQQNLAGMERSSSSLQNSLQELLTQNHRLTLNLKHKFSKEQDLRLRTSFQASNTDMFNQSNRDIRDASDLLANSNNTLYDSDGSSLGLNASLTYRRKLSDRGRTLVAEARANIDDGSSDGDLEALNDFYDNFGNVVSSEELFQLQSQLNNTLTNQQKLSWTEPLGKKRFLEFHGERRQINNDQDRQVFDTIDGIRLLNDPLSASLDQTYTYLSGGFNLRVNKEYTSFSAGVDIQDAQLKGDIRDQGITITNQSTRLLPTASFRHEFNAGKSLELRYQASTREPSMRELQPFGDNSDPINLYVGNPNLQSEYTHSGTLHLMMFDQFSFTNLFGFLRASYTKDKIANARTIDEQFRQTITPTNVDGDWQLNGSLNFGTPIRPLGLKINLSTRTMYNRGFEFINEEENASRVLRQTFDFRLENRDKDVVDALVGTKLTFNKTQYSLNPMLNRNYLNRTVYAELTYNLGEAWSISSGLDYRFFADEVFGTGQEIPLWRAEISRTMMNDRAEIKLVGLDLLNKNLSVNYSNTGNYIREEQINSLGRYLMLKFVYNLSGVGTGGPEIIMNRM